MHFQKAVRATGRLLALGIAFPGLGAVPAIAQDAAAASAQSETAGEPRLGDIVVTARRRDESLQSVPVSITALTGDALAAKSIVSVEQLRNFAPSLNISAQDRGEATFYIRGQGPGIVGGGQRNFTSVATYFAEVPTPIAGSGMLFDLSNVQVLKGPQGTLFGRNTTGGAVLFEPNRPTHNLEGYLKFSAGNYRYREIEGVLNIPLIQDVLALRLAGDVGRRRGYTKSVITGQRLDSRNNDSYRVSLLFTPTEEIENLTIVDSNFRDNSGSGLPIRQVYPAAVVGALANPLPPALSEQLGLPASFPLRVASPADSFIGCLSAALPGCGDGPLAPFLAAAANGGFGLSGYTPAQFYAALAEQQRLGARRVLQSSRLFRRNRDVGVTNKTIVRLSDTVTLKNIFSYRKERTAETTNLSGPFNYIYSVYPAGEEPYIRGFEQFTEEFQVQGKLPSLGLEYVAGYYHEQAKPGFHQSYRSYGFGTITNTSQDYRDTSDALFAHAELDITPRLQISGGIRYTWDDRKASSSVTFDDGTCNQVDPATGGLLCPAVGRAKFHALTGDATIQYKLTSRALVYGSYRHGYKSGGFNLPAPSADTATFRPETVDDFEIGLKADWDIGIPLRTNLALFRDKYSNIQIALPLFVNNTTISAVQNAASAVNKGIEFETTIVPARGLSLSGYFSYLSAKCQVDAGSACRIGRQIAYQPKWKWGVSGQYKLPIDGADVTLNADYSYTGKVTTPDPDAKALGLSDTLPGYGILGARIEWANAVADGIDLAVFGTNLTNKTYIVGGYSIASFLGVEPVLYGEPRMYGASLRVRFGGR